VGGKRSKKGDLTQRRKRINSLSYKKEMKQGGTTKKRISNIYKLDKKKKRNSTVIMPGEASESKEEVKCFRQANVGDDNCLVCS